MSIRNEDEFILVLKSDSLMLITLEEAKTEGISYTNADIIKGSEVKGVCK